MHAPARAINVRRRTPSSRHARISDHGKPTIHLAINLIHLLATMGAVIETAREICEWVR